MGGVRWTFSLPSHRDGPETLSNHEPKFLASSRVLSSNLLSRGQEGLIIYLCYLAEPCGGFAVYSRILPAVSTPTEAKRTQPNIWLRGWVGHFSHCYGKKHNKCGLFWFPIVMGKLRQDGRQLVTQGLQSAEGDGHRRSACLPSSVSPGPSPRSVATPRSGMPSRLR